MEVAELTSKEVGLLMTALDKLMYVILREGEESWSPIEHADLYALREKFRPATDPEWYVF